MGCDFSWWGTEPDIERQRRAAWLIESVVRRSGWAELVRFRRFNHRVTGFLLDHDLEQPVWEKTSIFLVGLSFFFEGPWPDEGSARHQFSFVFDNSTSDPPQLVTFEPVTDSEASGWRHVKRFFRPRGIDPGKDTCAAYRRGASVRMIANEGYLAEFLWSIRKQVLPGLRFSDDYNICEEVGREPFSVPPNFSDAVLDPSLKEFWMRGEDGTSADG